MTVDEILDTLSVDGANVFLLRSHRLQRQLWAYPVIERVRVEAFIPDRVRVTVYERQPAAVWDAGAQGILLDATGLGMREVSRQAPTTLPVISAPEGPFIHLGERVDPDPIHIAAQSTSLKGTFRIFSSKLGWRQSIFTLL